MEQMNLNQKMKTLSKLKQKAIELGDLTSLKMINMMFAMTAGKVEGEQVVIELSKKEQIKWEKHFIETYGPIINAKGE